PPVQVDVFEEVATDAGTARPADGPGGRRPVDGEDRAQAAGGEGGVPRPVRGGAGDDPAGRGLRALVRRGGAGGRTRPPGWRGRGSIRPWVVAGAFLLALAEGCSDREAEQRMRYDLRWKWALGLGLGLGLNDHGCDHSSLCVFRARLLTHEEEGRLFREIV